MIMYNSVKSWCDIPIEFKPFLRMDGAGDRVYGPAETIMCYLEGKVQLVRNLMGDEVTSTRKVYIPDLETINKFWPYRQGSANKPIAADILVLDGIDYPVLALSPFYRKGKIDVLVVYA